MYDNKSVVVDFFNTASMEGIDALRKFATDDMTFWSVGPGEIDLESYLSLVETFIESKADAPIKFTVKDVIAEGDSVVAEVEGYCPMRSGKIYANKYLFKLLMRDGKIAKIREYCDTAHLADALDLDH